MNKSSIEVSVRTSIPVGTMMLVPPRERNEPLDVWASRAIVIRNMGEPIACSNCGMTRNALMFRQYEAGTEWSGDLCCGNLR